MTRLGSIPVGQILGGKAAERSRIAAIAQPLTEMLDAEPAVEAVRRVPVKHLKIDPLPAALDSNGGKPDHQPSSDPLSARRLGDKETFKDTPRVGRAKSRTWGGTRQNRRARRRERRAAPRIAARVRSHIGADLLRWRRQRWAPVRKRPGPGSAAAIDPRHQGSRSGSQYHSALAT